MNPPEAYSIEAPDDELDVSRYLRILLHWWRLIVLCAVLGALAALGASLTMSKSYQAEASLAILRAGTVVNFDSKIRTVSDTDPNAPNFDPLGRRKSLVTLGTNPELAQTVVNQIGSQLPERLRDPTVLTRIVNVRNDGDLIIVQVTSVDPVQAALIANTWAQSYQDRVNAVYAENPLTVESLRTQTSAAQKDYAAAQAALADFLNVSPLEQLARQQNLLIAQLDSQIGVLAKLIQLEAEAKALRQRIASGSADASRGDELASLLLEASAFSNGAGLPVNLQIAFDPLNPTTTTADRLTQLDSLITAIQARQRTLQTDQYQALLQQLNQVKSQIEQTQAKQRELSSTRDLTWSTYQSLVTQMAAANITSEAGGQVVRVAAPAVTPTEPRSSNRLIMILFGGVVGLLIGTGLAFVLEFRASGLSSPERVRETLQLPTLAIFSELPLSVSSNLQNKAVSEELRRLRYTLFSHTARRVVAITSADSAEDSAALATNLAVILAQAGKKVLLVEANLREPLLHTLFRLERAHGLTEALRTVQENSAMRQFAKSSPIEGLSLLTAGAPVDDPAALLDTPHYQSLVAEAQEHFEIVILNTPPVLQAIDPVIAARAAQGVVLVLDRVNTLAATARRAKQQLDDAQVTVLGVVLSHTKVSQTEMPSTAQPARPPFWLGMRTRILQLLGPHPG